MKYIHKVLGSIFLFVCCNLIFLLTKTKVQSRPHLYKLDNSAGILKSYTKRPHFKRLTNISTNSLFQPKQCNSSEVLLIICVISTRDNFANRRAIRETWGSFTNRSIHMIFALGSSKPSEDVAVQASIQEEFEKHGDIIQGNFVDSYKNLTIKSIFAIKWITKYCSDAKFFLKADDDAYVNVPLLLKTLLQLEEDNSFGWKFILGHSRHGAKPVRNRWHRWYVATALFPNDTFPDYTSGGATYSMSMSAVKSIAQVMASVPQINLEDVYITGMCAHKANVTILNDDRIQSSKVTSKEKSTMEPAFRISGGSHSIDELKEVHDLVLPSLQLLGYI